MTSCSVSRNIDVKSPAIKAETEVVDQKALRFAAPGVRDDESVYFAVLLFRMA